MHLCDYCNAAKAIIRVVTFEKNLYFLCENCFMEIDENQTFDYEDLDCVEQET